MARSTCVASATIPLSTMESAAAVTLMALPGRNWLNRDSSVLVSTPTAMSMMVQTPVRLRTMMLVEPTDLPSR